VGLLVGVIVGLVVAVGFGVLLGDGVALGLGVKLGTIVVALGELGIVSTMTSFPIALHPPAININSNPKATPATTLIEFWYLPIN
jgi:hypothetical protein